MPHQALFLDSGTTRPIGTSMQKHFNNTFLLFIISRDVCPKILSKQEYLTRCKNVQNQTERRRLNASILQPNRFRIISGLNHRRPGLYTFTHMYNHNHKTLYFLRKMKNVSHYLLRRTGQYGCK